jgi:hypothetical protein
MRDRDPNRINRTIEIWHTNPRPLKNKIRTQKNYDYLRHPLSEETKRKLSIAVSKAKMGHITTIATRQKISRTLTGREISAETRAKTRTDMWKYRKEYRHIKDKSKIVAMDPRVKYNKCAKRRRARRKAMAAPYPFNAILSRKLKELGILAACNRLHPKNPKNNPPSEPLPSDS